MGCLLTNQCLYNALITVYYFFAKFQLFKGWPIFYEVICQSKAQINENFEFSTPFQ